MQADNEELRRAAAKSSLGQQSLEFIISACREESNQQRQEEIGYCFELFRRAVELDDGAAWAAVQTQYAQLVTFWLQRIAHEPLQPDELDALRHDAYTKFWISLTKQSLPLSHRFGHVGALLKYLNRCTATTFLDAQRQRPPEFHSQMRTVNKNLSANT